ncbi:tRNA pseudouridine(55) synthase TruB [Treponema sp.]|uniref:tRNA pseudouridine(55) synthase TruB n=1 Tax=Treponema sp. TaxID=166 RepID=UPI0025CCF408|nr:tRNA pseudouridine(55) synthase TruB [Treponema sp.]MCR5219303.1 tRNA pseudouridine(55) synthase TruB [Treponema sp.]
MKKNKRTSVRDGILLYAKTPGITSFSSLWDIKHALNTDKIGHTGTLDSFAEGLLVVLSGHLTHLVPHITGFTKTYQAVVCLGKETDTLDPSGQIIKTAPAVSREDFEKIIPQFTGVQLQVPPVYSALHSGGKRASDIIRSGGQVKLESRQVFIYKNQLLDFKEAGDDGLSYALLEITCSKGTYIRALARDMAKAAGSCAYLCALRRTQVGPFLLKDASCYSSFKDFTIEYGINNAKEFSGLNTGRRLTPESVFTDIRSHFLDFTPELAQTCGFEISELKKDAEKSYLNGRPLSGSMFNRITTGVNEAPCTIKDKEIAVFYSDKTFAGMIRLNPEHRLFYGFVVPKQKKKLKVFTWEELVRGEFPLIWKNMGTALTVGNFDGMHRGHRALIDRVKESSCSVKGLVTFTRPGDLIKNRTGHYEGDVMTLKQKLASVEEAGLDFAVLIDFSEDFSKIDGESFVSALVTSAGMKMMAEGSDFRCGYKGLTDSQALQELSEKLGFLFCKVEKVCAEGQSISSSLIRQAVKKGDFASVQKMLAGVFTLDCSQMEMTLSERKSSDPMMEWFASDVKSGQLLPQNGTYDVVAGLGENILHTSLFVTGTRVEVLLPTLDTARRLTEIKFVYKPNVTL